MAGCLSIEAAMECAETVCSGGACPRVPIGFSGRYFRLAYALPDVRNRCGTPPSGKAVFPFWQTAATPHHNDDVSRRHRSGEAASQTKHRTVRRHGNILPGGMECIFPWDLSFTIVKCFSSGSSHPYKINLSFSRDMFPDSGSIGILVSCEPRLQGTLQFFLNGCTG